MDANTPAVNPQAGSNLSLRQPLVAAPDDRSYRGATLVIRTRACKSCRQIVERIIRGEMCTRRNYRDKAMISQARCQDEHYESRSQ